MSSQSVNISQYDRPHQQAAFLTKTDPPLKWAGGKRRLVPRLRALYAPHRARRMVVPFAGGLGDVLGLWPDRAQLAALLAKYDLVAVPAPKEAA